MKQNSSQLKLITLALGMLLWLCPTFSGQAQGQIELANLSILLWPEFDRPATLVIYQGQLADSVSLPAQLSFRLPAHITEVNAVATLGETNQLINNAYTTELEAEFLRLDFTVANPLFQFEYYDPNLLTKAEQQRSLVYETTLPYPVSQARIELQQPAKATDVKTDPPASETFTGGDALTYHVVNLGSLQPETLIALSGSYQKTDSALTAAAVSSSPQNLSPPPAVETGDSPPAVAYWLIGGGVLLLIMASATWFYQNRPAPILAKSATKPTPRQRTPATKPQQVNFCPQCGTKRRPQAAYCHHCGQYLL